MNMKQKSPISVYNIQFYTCNNPGEAASIEQLNFDDRRDFLVDPTLDGIAVKIQSNNNCFHKGVRRNVSLCLVDTTSRCVAATQKLKVNIRKDEYIKDSYAFFPADSAGLRPGHSYKLVVDDTSAGQTLIERVIHLVDADAFPHPSEWYDICDGGLRPAWRGFLFKSIKFLDRHEYYIRFNFSQKFGAMPPAIFPEVELRLFHPGGEQVAIQFKEPICLGLEAYHNNQWFVEFPFSTYEGNDGLFYAELLCMEYPIAGFVFDTCIYDDQGTWFDRAIEPLEEYSPEAVAERWAAAPAHTYIPPECTDCDSTDETPLPTSDNGTETDNGLPDFADIESLSRQSGQCSNDESLPVALDHLTGLRSVKTKLTAYEHVVRFNKMRSDKGLPSATLPLHAMFLGSPGTGKTTVAKMIGAMLHRAGVLSKGHVVVRERATLLGQFYNSESEKTLEAIKEAQGGILFIDEAYQLHQPSDRRDPGKFVIDTLLTALADETNRDWMLVLAGYPDEMKQMFDLNPGLKSRIPDSNIYIFDDFTESELMEIAMNYLTRSNYILSDDAHSALKARLRDDYTRRGKNFGNARHVMNLIQTEILPAMAARVISEGLDDELSLTTIQQSDIPPLSDFTERQRPRIGFTA